MDPISIRKMGTKRAIKNLQSGHHYHYYSKHGALFHGVNTGQKDKKVNHRQKLEVQNSKTALNAEKTCILGSGLGTITKRRYLSFIHPFIHSLLQTHRQTLVIRNVFFGLSPYTGRQIILQQQEREKNYAKSIIN